MDVRRAKELIYELTNLVDQIDNEEISIMNKMPEDLKTEIKVKVIAILNELEIRPIKYADRPF